MDHMTSTRVHYLYNNSIRCGHAYKLENSRSNKTVRQKFFTQRVVKAWNNLPADIVEAPSINSFKNRLDEHWSDSQYETPNLNYKAINNQI